MTTTTPRATKSGGFVEDDFYADKSDLEVARHINLALLICNGISDEDAGFDTVTTLNDAGIATVARIIGAVRKSAQPK